MSTPYRPGKNTRAAIDAATSLYMWGSVVDMLEGGSAGHCNAVAVRRVIRIAKEQQQKDLARMDKAVVRINWGEA